MTEQMEPLTLSDEEVKALYGRCHNSLDEEPILTWKLRMIDLLGPDDCQFLIRSRITKPWGMWLSNTTTITYTTFIQFALRFDWEETAVRCTNDRKLEAVRIINKDEAITSGLKVISLL